MKSIWAIIVGVVALIISALIATSANAAPSSGTAKAVYAPKIGTFGNLPVGVKGSTKATQFAYSDSLVAAIRAMPNGTKEHPQQITVASFSGGLDSLADAYLDADKRGIEVDYVTYDHNGNRDLPDAMKRLKEGLQHPHTNGSSWKECKGSCSYKNAKKGNSIGTMHAKITTLSQVGNTPNVVFYHSGNESESSAVQQWNQWTVVSSAKLYNTTKNYILKMRNDKANLDCPTATDTTLNISVQLMPCKTADPYLKELTATTCVKGSIVRLGMFDYNKDADQETAQLVRLKKAGCDVQIIATYPIHWDTTEGKKLLAAGIPIYDAAHATGYYKYDRYWHDKMLVLSNIKQSGKTVSKAMAGSMDISDRAHERNNNFTLTFTNPNTIQWELQRFDFVKNGYTTLVPYKK